MSEQPNKTKQQLLDELNAIVSMLGDNSIIPTLDSVVSGPAEDSAASTEQDIPKPGQAPDTGQSFSDDDNTADNNGESAVDEQDNNRDESTQKIEIEAASETDSEVDTHENGTLGFGSNKRDNHHAQIVDKDRVVEENTEQAEQENFATKAHAEEEKESPLDQTPASTSFNDSAHAPPPIAEQTFQQEPSAVETKPSAVFEEPLAAEKLQPEAIPSAPAAVLEEPSTEVEPEPEAEEEDWMTTLELNSADLEGPATSKSFTEAEPGLELENLLLDSLPDSESEPSQAIDDAKAKDHIGNFKHSNTDTGFNDVIASLLNRPKTDYRRSNPFERSYTKPAPNDPGVSPETPSAISKASKAESQVFNLEREALNIDNKELAPDADGVKVETPAEINSEPNQALDSPGIAEAISDDEDLADASAQSYSSDIEAEYIPEPELVAELTFEAEVSIEPEPEPLDELIDEQINEPINTEQSPSELSGNQFEIAIPETEASRSDAPLSHLQETAEETAELKLGSELEPDVATPSDNEDSGPAPQQFTLDDALEGDYYPESGEFQYSFDVNPFGPYRSSTAVFPKPKSNEQRGELSASPTGANTPKAATTAKQAEMVDQLVAEYLPQIESKLRQRLLALLADEVDF